MIDFPLDITGLFPAGAVGLGPIALIVGFIAFILVFKTVLGFLKNLLVVAVASAIFPFVLVYFGYSVAITVSSLAGFMLLGIALYVILSAVKFVIGLVRKR